MGSGYGNRSKGNAFFTVKYVFIAFNCLVWVSKDISCVTRRPIFWVADQVKHKPVTETFVMHKSFVTTATVAPGNSGDFDFLSSKSLLKAPHCGDIQLVKPCRLTPQSYVLHCIAIFVYNTNPWHFHCTAGTIVSKFTAHFHYCYPPPCPSAGGGHGYK